MRASGLAMTGKERETPIPCNNGISVKPSSCLFFHVRAYYCMSRSSLLFLFCCSETHISFLQTSSRRCGGQQNSLIMPRANDSVGGPVDRCDSYFVKLLGVESYPVYVAFAIPAGNKLRIFLRQYPESVRKGKFSKFDAANGTVQQLVYGLSGRHRTFLLCAISCNLVPLPERFSWLVLVRLCYIFLPLNGSKYYLKYTLMRFWTPTYPLRESYGLLRCRFGACDSLVGWQGGHPQLPPPCSGSRWVSVDKLANTVCLIFQAVTALNFCRFDIVINRHCFCLSSPVHYNTNTIP